MDEVGDTYQLVIGAQLQVTGFDPAAHAQLTLHLLCYLDFGS